MLLLAFYAVSVEAMSGQVLVADLNAKYNSTVPQCSNNTPAYYCSGILLRAVDYSTFFKFWDYGSKATFLGSVAFSYIRSDIGSTSLNGGRKGGFILKDQTSALADGKALRLRCIFPFPTESLDDRASHGCGFAPRGVQVNEDLANCAKLFIPAVTPALWLQNFHEHQSLPKNQCSLSTMVAAEFNTSILVHDLIDAAWTAKPMEVLVETWDESKPAKLPLAAVFYDASAPAKLADAQKFQREYYQATSLYVPVVKLDFAAAGNNVFSFAAADQVYGQAVADRLNAQYNDVSDDCDGKAAYFCNGIIIRTTNGSEKYHAWDPSPDSIERNGISFSYIRTDVKMSSLYIGEGQGFILKASRFQSVTDSYDVSLRCAFSSDGATARREMSCGAHFWFVEDGQACLERGIDSIEKWKADYNQWPSLEPRLYRQCAIEPEKNQFSIFLQARNNVKYPLDLAYTNELVFAAWPSGIPRKLPLEAFFYKFMPSDAPRKAAQFMQKDYFESTGDFLPVIRLIFTEDQTRFEYYEEDQLQ